MDFVCLFFILGVDWSGVFFEISSNQKRKPLGNLTSFYWKGANHTTTLIITQQLKKLRTTRNEQQSYKKKAWKLFLKFH